MCIAVFLWQAHPLYPLILLLNRDEFHNRPTRSLEWWEGGGDILGGRDMSAGGTWLACSRDGRLAFVTNVRELHQPSKARSRGDLPVHFLLSKKSPMEYAEEVVKELDLYNGFNLVVADLRSSSMVFITNRKKEEDSYIINVSPGIHVLTNASLNSPWPKAQRLRQNFERYLGDCSEGELPVKDMVEKLMTDRRKDDISLLPCIYPPEREYELSSILVDMDTPLGRYGTRSSSALLLKPGGEVCFYEKHLENDLWKYATVDYVIKAP